MMIWSGYMGLTIAFVLLAAVLLWVVIAARGHTVAKLVLIPVTVWYGVALYYSAQNLMGWPTARAVPENSYVLAYRIREPEPKNDYPGAIFLWVSGQSPYQDNSRSSFSIIPRNLFNYHDTRAPRAFRLPYNRQMHQNLRQAQEQMKGQPGSLMRVKKIKSNKVESGSGSEKNNSPIKLEIINPMQMLPKKDYPR